MAKSNNTVPLGRSGTGAAFVLGDSNAPNRFLENLDYNQQLEQRAQAQQLQQAQQIAKDWQTNQLKVDGGLYWQPEFNQRNQQHIEEGIKLRQQGINPFNYNANNPRQVEASQKYLLDRQSILSDTANRKAMETEIGKRFQQVAANPSKYNPKDIAALQQYVQTPYAEARNMPLPTLRERFNPNAILDKITPAQVGNELVIGNQKIKTLKAVPGQTKAAIATAFANDPNAQEYMNDVTGTNLSIRDLQNIPKSPDKIAKYIDEQYSGNPEFRSELAAQGITSKNSDAYKAFVDSQVGVLYNAKSKFDSEIDSQYQKIAPKVKEMSSTLPNYAAEDQAIQRRRLQLSEQANARAAAKASGFGDDDNGVLFRQKWVEDMLNQVPNSGERLKALVSANPNYSDDLRIDISGSKISFRVPAKKVTSENEDGEIRSKTTPAREITIDRSDPASKSKLNALVSELTGENIKESKFATGEASGKIKGNVVSASPLSQNKVSYSKAEENGIAAVMKSSGRSRTEVIQALKKAGRIK